jgi:hypothetical protein
MVRSRPEYKAVIVPRLNLHKRVKYHIDEYVSEAMRASRRPFTLREVTLKIHEQTGILMRERTLEGAIHRYESRTGGRLLIKTPGTSEMYRLARY